MDKIARMNQPDRSELFRETEEINGMKSRCFSYPGKRATFRKKVCGTQKIVRKIKVEVLL